MVFKQMGIYVGIKKKKTLKTSIATIAISFLTEKLIQDESETQT
jgi:hypothetical protein